MTAKKHRLLYHEVRETKSGSLVERIRKRNLTNKTRERIRRLAQLPYRLERIDTGEVVFANGWTIRNELQYATIQWPLKAAAMKMLER